MQQTAQGKPCSHVAWWLPSLCDPQPKPSPKCWPSRHRLVCCLQASRRCRWEGGAAQQRCWLLPPLLLPLLLVGTNGVVATAAQQPARPCIYGCGLLTTNNRPPCLPAQLAAEHRQGPQHATHSRAAGPGGGAHGHRACPLARLPAVNAGGRGRGGWSLGLAGPLVRLWGYWCSEHGARRRWFYCRQAWIVADLV